MLEYESKSDYINKQHLHSLPIYINWQTCHFKGIPHDFLMFRNTKKAQSRHINPKHLPQNLSSVVLSQEILHLMAKKYMHYDNQTTPKKLELPRNDKLHQNLWMHIQPKPDSRVEWTGCDFWTHTILHGKPALQRLKTKFKMQNELTIIQQHHLPETKNNIGVLSFQHTL